MTEKHAYWSKPTKKIVTILLVIHSLLLTACAHKDDTVGPFQPMDIGKEANVSCFEIEPNGGIWLGLDGQGLAYRESATAAYQYYNKLSGTLPSDVVICTYRDQNGRQWFGTFGNGMFYWDGKTFLQPEEEHLKGKELEYVAGFAEDSNGSLWIATQKEGLVCRDTIGNIRFFNKDNSALPTNWLADIKTFDGKTLYVATGWGLFTIDTHSGLLAPLKDNEGRAFLEKQLIRILYPAPDGLLWIGTRTGLYVYHKDTHVYQHLTTDDGLGDNFVKAIGQDRHGDIWVTGEHCITRLSKAAQTEKHPSKFVCRQYQSEDGIGEAVLHVRAIARDAEGRMLFGTSIGVLAYHPDKEESAGNNMLPAVLNILVGILLVVLIVMVLLLLRHRKRPAAHSPAYTAIEPSPLEVTPVDEQLKEKAIRMVEENISNADFSVEQLSSALGMSRGHLYKRLLAITGKTPIEFIRTIRVKRGRQLLKQSGEGVSQVAWQIGMSPKQFAKYFKEEYGLLPSEFVKKQESDDGSGETVATE